MKAIQFDTYGDSGVLQLNEVDKPSIKDDEVLVKISTTTVNPIDVKLREGKMKNEIPIPLPFVPGSDFCGIVEAVSSKVSRIKPGDRVYGGSFGGTHAEYITVSEKKVALVPVNISDADAAALEVPLAVAYSTLFATAKFKAGEKILIHAGAGGVGSILIQVAKAMGGYVITTASTQEIERVKMLGADEVIDYKSQDFSQVVKDVDLVLDLLGGETQTKSFGVLKKGGMMISLTMPPPAGMAEQFGVTALFLSSDPGHEKLEFFQEWIEKGLIKAQVVATFALADAAKAQDMVSKGGVNGKVVIEID